MTDTSEVLPLVPGRDCGACSMCCKLMTIDFMTPPKPAGKWCDHCKPGRGCAIWQARPAGCADFHCAWRRLPGLSDAWRPDRSGFIINQQKAGVPWEVLVDPGKPDAWRREPYYSEFKRISLIAVSNREMIVVIAGPRQWIVLPDEDIAIPSQYIGGDYQIYRDSSQRWRVKFLELATAS